MLEQRRDGITEYLTIEIPINKKEVERLRNWNEVANSARDEMEQIHLARIFAIMSEKGSELPDNDP